MVRMHICMYTRMYLWSLELEKQEKQEKKRNGKERRGEQRRGEKRRGEERGRRTNWPHGSIGSAACTILFGTRIETVSESDVSAAAMDVEERGVESHGRSRLAIVVLAREWLVLQ